MPRDFRRILDVMRAAENWQFRFMAPGESDEKYREALADFVHPLDVIEAHEIRTGRGWDTWSATDHDELRRLARERAPKFVAGSE